MQHHKTQLPNFYKIRSI